MSDDDATSFWDAHRSFVRSSRILSVFARLALFPEELLPFDGEVSVNAPNVVRDLSIGEEAIWRDYAHKVRKNVNRARANGLTVEIDLTGSAIDVFADVYWETMRRRSAAEGYFFGLEFFRRIVRDIQGGFAFFHVLAEDRVVSTELVLVSAQRLYSFLGGTREEALDLRANDLLKHEIIRWGCAQGKKAFVLGGGYGGADGIFKYKLGFAPQGETPFRVGKSVVDVASCDRLVELRREWERQSGRDWRPRENFFPSYRA
jgi:hypothetical protein